MDLVIVHQESQRSNSWGPRDTPDPQSRQRQVVDCHAHPGFSIVIQVRAPAQ